MILVMILTIMVMIMINSNTISANLNNMIVATVFAATAPHEHRNISYKAHFKLTIDSQVQFRNPMHNLPFGFRLS